MSIRFSRVVESLPSSKPFIAPESMEREMGRPFELRLGANESSFGMSPRALEALRSGAPRLSYYGDPDNFELKNELSRLHRVPVSNIVIGCGIDDLLAIAARCFLNPGDPVATSFGGYPTFNYVVNGVGGRIETTPYVNEMNDLAGLSALAHRVGAKLVFLANPDNPSGSWHSSEAVVAFHQSLPSSSILLLDEAYGEFAPGPVFLDAPNVIRLRTFSKAYGMAGARLGYAFASPSIVEAFEKVRLHFEVVVATQIAGLEALRDQAFMESVVREVAKGRRDYEALAASLGFRALPSATNFVTIDVGSRERAELLVQQLRERFVFVRKPGLPPLDRCIRVTVGTQAERERFGAILTEIVRA